MGEGEREGERERERETQSETVPVKSCAGKCFISTHSLSTLSSTYMYIRYLLSVFKKQFSIHFQKLKEQTVNFEDGVRKIGTYK